MNRPVSPGSASYALLDSGHFLKLEQVGSMRLVRPAPQAVWKPRLPKAEWDKADATFRRKEDGFGSWGFASRQRPPEPWLIEFGTLKFLARLTDFGHLGFFVEHAATWDRIESWMRARAERNKGAGKERPKVLNLFAYTGGASLAAARGGAEVVHVDASKTTVSWAREMAAASGLAEAPIRWIIDDAMKFVQREQRRGVRYDGVVVDPPSFGRGPKGELWKIEDQMLPLMDAVREICAPDLAFLLLSSHSEGFTPVALRNILSGIGLAPESLEAGEMCVRETSVTGESQAPRQLPAGAFALFRAQDLD